MYTEIIPKIKTLLEGVVLYEVEGTEYKPVVYPYPLESNESPSRYPAIVFFPTNADNQFSTADKNFKQVNFTAIVLINAENLSNEQIFTVTMPNAVDKVVEELDKGWDFGSIDGCRTWARADAIVWGVSTNESGRYAFADINIIIKLSTN
jgi:hypothetical protein